MNERESYFFNAKMQQKTQRRKDNYINLCAFASSLDIWVNTS